MSENEKYKSIDEVQYVIEDGRTIEMIPGLYRDYALFEANNITVHSKGWVERQEKEVAREGIEFVHSHVVDRK